jgi:transposase
VRPLGESFVVERNPRGLAELVARLHELSPDIVALEATGGFEIGVSAALAGAGLPTAVVNLAQVRAFARALGNRVKTDPIDAAVIAHFAEATGLIARPVADQAMQLLADLEITMAIIRSDPPRIQRVSKCQPINEIIK